MIHKRPDSLSSSNASNSTSATWRKRRMPSSRARAVGALRLCRSRNDRQRLVHRTTSRRSATRGPASCGTNSCASPITRMSGGGFAIMANGGSRSRERAYSPENTDGRWFHSFGLSASPLTNRCRRRAEPPGIGSTRSSSEDDAEALVEIVAEG
jgi:hypothetical protein